MAGIFEENKQMAYSFGAHVSRNYELSGSKLFETELDSGTVFVRNSTATDTPYSYGLLIIESSRLKADTRMIRQTMIDLNTSNAKSRIGLYNGLSLTWTEWL